MSKEMDKKSKNVKKGKKLSEKTVEKINGGGRPEIYGGEVTVQFVCCNCGAVLKEFKIARGAEYIGYEMGCEKCGWIGIPYSIEE